VSRSGAKLQVYLSRSESTYWSDADTRAESLKRFRRLASEKGRKYVEVFDDHGRSLEMVSA
jgi:hypothetical protein